MIPLLSVGEHLLATRWQFIDLDWRLLKGKSGTAGQWHAPVVARVKKISCRNVIEYDVYFLPFAADEEEGYVRLLLPSKSGVMMPRLRMDQDSGSLGG